MFLPRDAIIRWLILYSALEAFPAICIMNLVSSTRCRAWRLELRQPRREALLLVSVIEGVHPNFLQIALDWLFLMEEEHYEAHVFALRHLDMPNNHGWLRWKEKGQWKTVYFAPRRAPKKLSLYSDRPSKAAIRTPNEGSPLPRRICFE